MAFQTATNPDTGERFALIDNEWVPFSKTASNPDTGEKFGLIKNEWMPLSVKAASSPAATPTAVKPPEPRPEDQSVLRQFADVPLKVGAGLVTGVRMVADAFGANTDVSKSLRGVEDEIAALYSAQSKKDSKEIARIMKEAEDKGILDQIIAGAKAMTVAPVDVLSNSIGTAGPAIAAGVLTTLTGGAPLVVAGVGLGTGAVMGAGTIKSAIYDATKQVLTEKTKMTPEQIEAAAVKAQEYGGKNLDQILLGTAIGAVGARTGVEPVLARQLAKDIVGRVSAEEAAATVATQATGREAAKAAVKAVTEEETKKAAERGVVKQGAITAGKEFATEFPQGGQEQMAQNIALQREGFDVPTMRGVVSQGTMEGLAGAGMGAAGGAREGYTAKREVATDQSADQDYRDLFTTYDKEKKTKAPQPNEEQQKIIDVDTRVKQEEALPAATAPTPYAESVDVVAKKEISDLSFTELVAKIDALKDKPGNTYTATVALPNIGEKIDTQYKVVRGEDGWAVVTSKDSEGAEQPHLIPPARSNALTDEQLIKSINDKNELYNSTVTKKGATSGTDTTASGAGAGVDAAADTTV
jgi:hypothetical protein